MYVVFVSSDVKRLHSTDHICKRLYEKSWIKCLRSVIKKVFVFSISLEILSRLPSTKNAMSQPPTPSRERAPRAQAGCIGVY
ncbi:hypothetical protein HanIR_Chr02g0051571 [Helianthus annuus]|nr:hypothetical protein HanIR_Chr02g0051571 [Helianthus annuus]